MSSRWTAGRRWSHPFRQGVVTICSTGVLLLVGCAGESQQAREAAADRPTRKAEFTRCPAVHIAVPDGFRPARRELPALSDNHMGEVTTYRSGIRRITVYSGPDLYDALEDLDTTADAVETARHEFTLYSTLLAPELLIAVLDVEDVKDDRFDEPCDSAGVLTRHVERRDMMALLRGFRIERG
jgi:hypothetical protein